MASPVACSADDQPKTFVALSYSLYDSANSLDRQGHPQTSSCAFRDQTVGLYISHQINPRDNWFGDTSFSHPSSCGNSNSGLGDVEFGYQRGIGNDARPTQFAIKGSISLPSGYNIADNLRLGLGRPGAQLGMTYFGGFQGQQHHYGFVSAGAAVRAYTTYPAPQLETNIGVGYGATPGLLVIESYFGTTHLGGGGHLTNIGANPFVTSVYDSYQMNSSLIFSLTPRLAFNVGYWNLLGGFNVGTGSQVSAGFWFRY